MGTHKIIQRLIFAKWYSLFPQKSEVEQAGSNKVDSLFDFEQSRKNIRETIDTDEAYTVLLKRLNVSPALAPVVKKRLLDYTTHVLKNISWYKEKIEQEAVVKFLWFAGTIMLGLFAPVVLVIIEHFVKDSTLVYAIIGGLLSGLVAMHRSIGNYLQHRKTGTLFAETAAELKSLHYSLEERWSPLLKTRRLEDVLFDFQNDLDNAIRHARRVVADEQMRFYLLDAPPKIDLNLELPETSPKGGHNDLANYPTKHFEFSSDFMADEITLILECHRKAYNKVKRCQSLSDEARANMKKAYKRRINHIKILNPEINGWASDDGTIIGVNLDNLIETGQQEHIELQKTLLHEMMHCAGYHHIPFPGQNDKEALIAYFESEPLTAERCISGATLEEQIQADGRGTCAEQRVSDVLFVTS